MCEICKNKKVYIKKMTRGTLNGFIKLISEAMGYSMKSAVSAVGYPTASSCSEASTILE